MGPRFGVDGENLRDRGRCLRRITLQGLGGDGSDIEETDRLAEEGMDGNFVRCIQRCGRGAARCATGNTRRRTGTAARA